MDSDGYDIESFLDGDGAIGVIVQIDREEGMLFKEIRELVVASHTTVGTRLGEAIEMDLLVEATKPSDHGNSKRYQLTRRGRKLRSQMELLGMDEAYQNFFEAHQEIEAGEDELVDWLSDSDITDPRWPPDPDYPHTESL